MSDKDTITLPREVAEHLTKMLEECPLLPNADWSERDCVALNALRTALAAPRPEPDDSIPLHKSDCALLIGGYQCTCEFHQRNSKTPPALAAPPAPTQAAKSLITAPKPVLGLISNEVRAALKAADAVESQEAYLTRTPALAAEQPKPEPVAWMESPHGAIRANPNYRLNFPSQLLHWQIPLYTAPPATHPGYVIGSHWLETAYSRICAGEAEADVLRDCGWERVDEALRRDAEKWRKAQAKYIAWQKGGKAEAMGDKT